MQISVKNPEVLLIIAPWDLPVTFLECRATISPGIRVNTYKRDNAGHRDAPGYLAGNLELDHNSSQVELCPSERTNP